MRLAASRQSLAVAALVMVTLAGCATPYSQGLVAARQGRYVDASVLYEEALARDPDRLDAIVQLGIVRYKLGALDGAIELLERARPRAPAEPTVRLYFWGPYPYPPAPYPGCWYAWRGGWLRCY